MNIYNSNYYKKGAFGFESAQRKDHDHILDILNIKESDNILEVGCGLGRLLKKIPSQKKTGIDISETAIDECKKYGLVNVFICDAENGLPFEKCRFDIVILNEVLEHFKNPKYVLGEIHRILKNNGRLLITTPVFHPLFLNKFALSEGHFSEMTIKDMELILNNFNYKILIHKVNGLFFLTPILEILFFRPFRFFRKNNKGAIKIDNLHKFADRKILKFLINYRGSFKNFGQNQLILAEKQSG